MIPALRSRPAPQVEVAEPLVALATLAVVAAAGARDQVPRRDWRCLRLTCRGDLLAVVSAHRASAC